LEKCVDDATYSEMSAKLVRYTPYIMKICQFLREPHPIPVKFWNDLVPSLQKIAHLARSQVLLEKNEYLVNMFEGAYQRQERVHSGPALTKADYTPFLSTAQRIRKEDETLFEGIKLSMEDYVERRVKLLNPKVRKKRSGKFFIPPSSYNDHNAYCLNYNWDQCTSKSCVLRHYCSGCRGKHPAKYCPTISVRYNWFTDYDCNDHLLRKCLACGSSRHAAHSCMQIPHEVRLKFIRSSKDFRRGPSFFQERRRRLRKR